jgi:type I restriction enzyme, S subunit
LSGFQRHALKTLVAESSRPSKPANSNEVWNLNLDQIESDTGRVLAKQIVSVEKLGPSTYPFEAGTVLYSKLRPYLNKVLVADDSGVATTELVPLRCNPEKLFPHYLAYFLRSSEFLQFANIVVAGAKMPRMVMSEFWDYKIPVPPLPEQHRIAAILDQADALRAKRREALAQLDSLTQSIFIEMFGEPISNPMGWKTLPVGDVTDCIVPGRDKPKSFSGEIPWVTTEDLLHLGVTYNSSKKLALSPAEIGEVRARVIPSGSVVISCVGNLGIASIAGADMVINQQLHSYQCNEDLNNIYLMHAVAKQAGYMYAKASSTTLPYMNKSVCNSIPILVPPIDIQSAFADRYMEINTQKSMHHSFLRELDSLFVSLQHRAFRGEL